MSSDTTEIPEPNISITQTPIFYNKKWGFSETITLTGKIIDPTGYLGLLEAQNTILSTYGITDGALIIGEIERTNVFLQSVDFAPSNFLSNIDYTVVLVCYPNDKFTSAGIINPINTWNFSETRERVLTVTHTVSAAGINDAGLDETGFDNAREFVQALVYPASTAAIPANFSKCFQEQDESGGSSEGGGSSGSEDPPISSSSEFVLISQAENINRVNGTYSITEVYEIDLLDPSSKSKMTFTISVDEPVQGFHKASISGTITGGINTTMTELETIFDTVDFKQKIEDSHSITLNETPITKTKKLNDKAQSISFSFEFDDAVTNIDDDTLILDLSLNESKGEDKIKKYTLRGTLKGRSDLTDRFSLIESAYNEKIDIYKSENVFALFSNYYDIDDVSKNYTSASVTKNKFKGEINFSVSATNEDPPPHEKFEKFDHTVNIEYPFYRAKPYALVGEVFLKANSDTEQYVLQNLEYFERGKLSINGTAVIRDDVDLDEGIGLVNDEVISIASEFLSGDEVLNVKQIESKPSFGKKITFRYSWDYSERPINIIEDLSLVNMSSQSGL
tara:strand:+ start:9517 stop:11208 length:1692 start_codon:yes stop_codon:yes gene_type:complete